jgi:hypothetical protein
MNQPFFLPIAVVSIICVTGCDSERPVPAEITEPEPAAFSTDSLESLIDDQGASTQESLAVTSGLRFADKHEALGLNFIYLNGSDERALMVQSTGGGGGWIDYDRDGFQDVFFVQGGNPTGDPADKEGDRLFRNLNSKGFIDNSASAIPIEPEFGQGMAAADFNDDGFEDLFVSNTSADQMLMNCGDGTFVDVTEESGTGDKRWGTSAAWYDLDLDGDLDLFVCNYCRYDSFNPVVCRKEDGAPAICHPEALDPDFSECYENLGDGRFAPVAAKWGLADKPGKALGVVAADFNVDGRPDLFVANDTMANFLYLGKPEGGFTEQGVQFGCAYNSLGQYQANMGVACNDYDGNGYLDLYVTTFTDDSNTLFANLGATGFRDVTRLEGLHAPTIETLGFGTIMMDLDANDAMDIFVANGHIDDWREKKQMWKMPPEMFTWGNGTWNELSSETVGDFLNEEHLGRAVSCADSDNDGDTDLLVVHQNEPAALLINESAMGHWLRVELIGRNVNRRGFGARVIVRQGDRTWTQQLVGGSSYLTSHQPVLSFGFGETDSPCDITVIWPGAEEPTTIQSVSVDQLVRLTDTGLMFAEK